VLAGNLVVVFFLRLVIRPEAGLVALFVNELTNALFAALGFILKIRSLLSADKIIFGVVIGHVFNAAYGVLRRL
jgi:hypothetical protein